MYLEIITPEKILISQEDVTDVKVPGVLGEFQLLDDHAPIVSVLEKGHIFFSDKVQLPEHEQDQFGHDNGKYSYPIKGGVIENRGNKTVILVD
jgi:F-type H+-transporting ATPase subunit epsilon